MLTDAALKAAKPKDRAYKLTDGQGLHLFVTPAGGKLWRQRYVFAGKEKLLSLGPYPDVSLAKARELRDGAKATIRSGRDPSVEKKVRRALGGNPADSFEAIARDWHARQAPTWTERHADDVLDSLEGGVFPMLGALPIREISVPMVLGVLRLIEARPAVETARRVRQRMCHAVELSPAYVDVAIRRWQAFTGQQAVLVGRDASFAEIAAERGPDGPMQSDGAKAKPMEAMALDPVV